MELIGSSQGECFPSPVAPWPAWRLGLYANRAVGPSVETNGLRGTALFEKEAIETAQWARTRGSRRT